jgi:Tol biopolymer transport system component
VFGLLTWFWVGVASSVSAPMVGRSQALARDGNISVMRSDGSRLQVTSSGEDSEPDLSADGSKVVFVRSIGANRSEIWVAPVTGSAQARVIVSSPVQAGGRQFGILLAPMFSPDSKVIYFLVPFAATTQAILSVPLADSPVKPRFVAAALTFRVVQGGEYRGDLVAQIRKAKLAPGYYDWYWLLSPDGKELGVVGENEDDVTRFMELQQ